MGPRPGALPTADPAGPLRVGILADTHGLLRPEVLERLAGCDLLLHAGDVGDPAVLARLEAVAPVWAVRGNVDGAVLPHLPEVLSGRLGGVRGIQVETAAAPGDMAARGDVAQAGLAFRMTHTREDVAPSWIRDAHLVVFGHSHRPELEWQSGCLLLNPGSCGPRRFRLPLTVAILAVHADRLVPQILAVE
jgi:putative phosphoesterase